MKKEEKKEESTIEGDGAVGDANNTAISGPSPADWRVRQASTTAAAVAAGSDPTPIPPSDPKEERSIFSVVQGEEERGIPP
jgi:hypothetical protein